MSFENDTSFNDIDYEFLSQSGPEKASSVSLASKKITKSPLSESPSHSKSPKVRATRNLWKPHEDELLLKLYAKHGPKWTLIGNTIGGRTCKQVRDRYLNHINPEIDYAPFTPHEDLQLVSLQALLGSKWKEISERMPGRSPAQVKNRFYLYLNPNKKQNINSLSVSKNGSNSTIEMNIGSYTELAPNNTPPQFIPEEDIGFGFISYDQVDEAEPAPQFDIFQDFSNFLGSK